ncbi:putative endonuclease exonuclease phosphatase family protein [Rosellinia necatrix]|uniref:Putative endonuclease exonuclease phosphatase family protein n=1 Tax=Rosellinia necatrix TaxID=77044 RepID=A0A1W2TI96_ROSNE|nr:putative endonuclease exonuclease phosphatase family protein [Rosellinia necatrix]
MKMKTSASVATAAALLGVPVRAATSGVFNVLSMNVAGLPAFLNDNGVPGDKTTNSEMIGSKFAEHGYDLIHAQEDFNYHAYIYKTDTHAYRTATSGGVPFGSGLNSLSNYDWTDFARVKWDVCSDASQSDCLTPKGFTFMRVRLSPAADGTASYVDAYNLHTDAGTEAGDLAARASNLYQVADHIAARSAGNAVVVFGDTNSRYTRAADVLPGFLARAGLTDAQVELVHGGVPPAQEVLCANPSTTDACETVDKVFYRAGPLLSLAATHWAYAAAAFLQPDGSVLTDHNPVTANFTWAAGAALRQSAFWGGDGGDWFNDAVALAARSGGGGAPTVAALSLRGASRLDGVAVTLADGTALAHGGTGGTASALTLAAGEAWTGALVCQGQRSGGTRIFYLKATTSAGRTLEAGTATSDCATFAAPDGWAIVGFLGHEGDEIDRLAFVYAPR